MTEYAEKELHPILQKTFKDVVKQEKEQTAAKRKASSLQKTSGKRARRQNSLLQTTSNAMSGLSTS